MTKNKMHVNGLNNKILLIDDDPILVKIIQKHLVVSGYQIDVCDNAEDAILLISENPTKYNLLLLDIILPGMSGLDALPKIVRTVATPVIMMTADRDPKLLEEAFTNGAADYLVKPFDISELVFRIKTHLERVRDKEKLKKSEENYKNLFNSIHEGIVTTDENLKIKAFNPAAQNILQIPREKLFGLQVNGAFFTIVDQMGNPVDAEMHPARISLRENKFCSDVILGISQSQSSIWVSVNSVPLVDSSSGIVTGTVISFRDITQLKLAEDELLNERMIYTGGPVVIFKWDRINWNVKYVSDNIESQLGYKKQDILDGTVAYHSLIHPDDKERLEETIHNNITGKDWVEVEYRLLNAHKKYIWVMVYIRIFFIGSKITHYQGYITNITERKITEERLREREADLSEAQRIAHLGNWSLDLNTRVFTWSDEIYRIFRIENLKNEKITFEFFMQKVHPDDREKILVELEKLITEKKSDGMEHRIILPDGTYRIVLQKGELFRDSFDGRVKIIGIIQDITESKQSEEALLESRLKSKAILENITDAVIITNKHGIVIDFYPGAIELFGYQAEEVLHKNLMMILLSNKDTSFISFSEDIQSRKKIPGEDSRNEVTAITKTGKTFPAEISITDWELKGQRYYTVIIRDISTRKHTEEILRQTAKMESLGHLTGGIAHDFNNLLGIISGNLELLARVGDPDAKAIKRIGTAQKASHRAADLTRKLLAYSRKQPSISETIQVNEVLRDMQDIMQSTLGKNIEIDFDLEDDLWLIKNDKSELENTILNLLINAKDAMPEGGSVFIKTINCALPLFHGILDKSPAGDYIQLSVKDTGSGIPPEIMGRIFDPFFTTKTVDKGTGLGLSIVYSFVKNSSGNLQIITQPDQGTEFIFYFPAYNREHVPELAEIKKEQTPTGTETILVLDDEEDLAEIAEQILLEKGYTVYKFSTPYQVLDFLEKGNPVNLIFSDIVIPGDMDGLQLASRIKESWPMIKILLTSGYPQKAASGMHFRDIPFPLITKPYKSEELLQAVRKILDIQ